MLTAFRLKVGVYFLWPRASSSTFSSHQLGWWWQWSGEGVKPTGSPPLPLGINLEGISIRFLYGSLKFSPNCPFHSGSQLVHSYFIKIYFMLQPLPFLCFLGSPPNYLTPSPLIRVFSRGNPGWDDHCTNYHWRQKDLETFHYKQNAHCTDACILIGFPNSRLCLDSALWLPIRLQIYYLIWSLAVNYTWHNYLHFTYKQTGSEDTHTLLVWSHREELGRNSEFCFTMWPYMWNAIL